MKLKLQYFILPAAALMLSGCFDSPESDVQNFINTRESRVPKKSVDLGPLPQVADFVPYNLKENLGDPFVIKSFVREPIKRDSFTTTEEKIAKEVTSCEGAECARLERLRNHQRQFLEYYEINSYAMVGALEESDGTVSALLRTPVGVFNVRVGDYLGRNFGQIIEIEPDRIVVQEQIKSATGYTDKKSVLNLIY